MNLGKMIGDYTHFVQKVEALIRPHIQIETVEIVNDCLLYRVLLGGNQNGQKKSL